MGLVLLLSSFTFGCAFGVIGCDDDAPTSEVTVRADESVDFSAFQTFSVVTADMVDPPPDLGEDQEAFNNLVNELLIEAMREEPVCLAFIPPERA